MNNKEKLIIQDVVTQLGKIDYQALLEVVEQVIVFYATHKIIKSYILHRDYKPKNFSKVVLPPELKLEYSDIDIKKIFATKYGESIVEFIDVILNNFKEEDLINFYNNINDLKVNAKKFNIQNLVFRSYTVGEYDTKKNKIDIDDGVFELNIYHELFHMASSIYKDKVSYSGFHLSFMKLGGDSLGKGINEGYTELLSKRYFVNNDMCAYSYEVLVAERLEQIVGKEKMQSLYLNANLKGLIDELKKYISEDEVMNFIHNMDFLNDHLYDKKLQLFEKNMIVNCLKNVNKFLILCYSKKIQKQVVEGKFSTYYGIGRLTKYISSLPTNVKIKNNVYEIMTEKDIKEILKLSFENKNEELVTSILESKSVKK